MRVATYNRTSWSPILGSILAAWHGVGDHDRAESPARARRFVDTAASLSGDRREELLAALRQRLETIPVERVHSSWLLEALPDEPLLRMWALDRMPRPARQSVLAELKTTPDKVLLRPLHPPAWFADWWHRELRTTVSYPAPVPGGVERAAVLEYLDLLTPAEIERVLRWTGLRPLAAALRGLEQEAVVTLVLALPPHLRQRLGELSREDELPTTQPWFDRLCQIREAREPVDIGREASELPLLLALDDLAAQAPVLGSADGAARLAYRLPAKLGRKVLFRLAEGPGEFASRDPGEWQRLLARDFDELVRNGGVRRIDLATEGMR